MVFFVEMQEEKKFMNFQNTQLIATDLVISIKIIFTKTMKFFFWMKIEIKNSPDKLHMENNFRFL